MTVRRDLTTSDMARLRLVWSRELSADDGMDEIEILIPPTKALRLSREHEQRSNQEITHGT